MSVAYSSFYQLAAITEATVIKTVLIHSLILQATGLFQNSCTETKSQAELLLL